MRTPTLSEEKVLKMRYIEKDWRVGKRRAKWLYIVVVSYLDLIAFDMVSLNNNIHVNKLSADAVRVKLCVSF